MEEVRKNWEVDRKTYCMSFAPALRTASANNSFHPTSSLGFSFRKAMSKTVLNKMTQAANELIPYLQVCWEKTNCWSKYDTLLCWRTHPSPSPSPPNRNYGHFSIAVNGDVGTICFLSARKQTIQDALLRTSTFTATVQSGNLCDRARALALLTSFWKACRERLPFSWMQQFN